MTIRSRAGLAHCPERDFLFGAAEYLRVYLWSSPLGKKPVVRLREAFQSFLFPEL